MEEEKIIKKIQGGDLDNFGELYDFYVKKIYNFIYYKTHHKETAEDLTSKTFMKALRSISNFSIDGGSFASWLYTIARNNVIDHYRTKKQESDIEDIWDLAGDENIERDIDCVDKIRDVEQYLSKLESRHREIVTMRIWQDMSYKEIAEVLGQSEASCKMMYSRVIRKLRKEMPLVVFLAMFL